MALIAKECVPPKREQISIRLNPDVLAMLNEYCRFIESSQNYVVEQSLCYTFDRDRAFAEWLTHNETTGEKCKDSSPNESNSRKNS